MKVEIYNLANWPENTPDFIKKRLAKLPLDYQKPVQIILTDDQQVQQLNATWRGKNKPTNILSFPSTDNAEPGIIYLAKQTIEHEAAQKNYEHHLIHLVIHGILHLAGHTHRNDEAEVTGDTYKMQQQEITLLAQLGISSPYDSAF